jgi:ADP-ribosyl-[dinitrogen reductase] hydrolase
MCVDPGTLSRAEGCLLGQLAGDSLGSLVEFQSPEEILRNYPDGVRELAGGGTWGTIAGQPTDDSEMGLALARMLMKFRRYDADEARKAYLMWLNSSPFDCGSTVAAGLRGHLNRDSQANGALMRIAPLGIFCCNQDRERTSQFARQDAALTHPHPICLQTNSLFTMAIAEAVGQGKSAQQITTSDATGIRAFRDDLGRKASLVRGVVLHGGKARPLEEGVLALPWGWLVPK